MHAPGRKSVRHVSLTHRGMETPVDALTARVLLQTLDELAVCVAVLTRDRRIIAMNIAAAALANECDGVRVDRGALRLSERDVDADFARVVASAQPQTQAVLVVGRGERPPLHVAVRALPACEWNAVLVHLVDPERQLRLDANAMLRLYRFSPAEARVAAEAALGATAAEMAQTLSLSVHTVRSHLKSIFAKTGATTRGELVRLLLGAASGLRPIE
jgi:DNA-binding CsgD family transcriptional regulator